MDAQQIAEKLYKEDMYYRDEDGNLEIDAYIEDEATEARVKELIEEMERTAEQELAYEKMAS